MGNAHGQMQEYDRLYQEIGSNSQIVQNVFVANVAVTSGLIGYGLDAERAEIFLVPFAIIVPSLFFLASQLEGTTRIATYLNVFLERDNESLNWETRWLKLREQGLLPLKRKFALSLSGLYGLISVVCVLLTIQYWQFNKGWLIAVAMPILILVATGARMLVRSFSVELCKEYVEAWERLATIRE